MIPAVRRAATEEGIDLPEPGEGAEGNKDDVDRAEECLRQTIRSLGSVMVALSGGVDSCLLAVVATQELPQRVAACTALSPLFFEEDAARARGICRQHHIEHLEVRVDHLALRDVSSNPPDRCYHCKRETFGRFADLQQLLGLSWLVDGTNADDALDYRPGARAGRERHVRSPLAECGIGKETVRAISRKLGLADPERPSVACYASRFRYGTPITAAGVERVRRGEEALRRMGFRQVRLRDHGDVARIEVQPADLPELLERREEIVPALTGLGYLHVCLDLQGYRTGSLNEGLGRTAHADPR